MQEFSFKNGKVAEEKSSRGMAQITRFAYQSFFGLGKKKEAEKRVIRLRTRTTECVHTSTKTSPFEAKTFELVIVNTGLHQKSRMMGRYGNVGVHSKRKGTRE